MDFGLGELAIGEILYFIGESIFGAEALASSTTAVTTFFENLLGEPGIQAMQNIVDIITGQSIPETVGSMEEFGGFQLKKEIDDIFIWENVPELNQVVDKATFMDNVQVVAHQMMKNGIDVTQKEGKAFLLKTIKKTIELASSGVKTSIDPKILVPSIIGGGLGTKFFINAQKKAQNIFKSDHQSRLERIRKELESEKDDEKERQAELAGIAGDSEIIG
jgi:hypothetical protein